MWKSEATVGVDDGQVRSDDMVRMSLTQLSTVNRGKNLISL
jgi:hypothetical protein